MVHAPVTSGATISTIAVFAGQLVDAERSVGPPSRSSGMRTVSAVADAEASARLRADADLRRDGIDREPVTFQRDAPSLDRPQWRTGTYASQTAVSFSSRVELDVPVEVVAPRFGSVSAARS
jgi:hypothetical protein